jgi:predicted lactoylglutathione lyase
MGNYNEQLVKAGIMVAGEGLHPSSRGARVTFSGTKRTVVDGPFTETKELIAGYWLWQVKSMEEAIEWVKRCPNPTGAKSEIEIRPIFEADEFGEEFTPDLRDQEARLRCEIEQQRKVAKPTAPKLIFVNLPVSDLKRAITFFTKLGYTFNPQFTDEKAACMVVSDTIHVMLLVETFFKTFTPKPIADAKCSTESLVCLSAESRDAVNRIVETALSAGARRYKEPEDHGFMYGWGFEDLDGHIWEYMWMDPAHVQKQ